MVNQKGLFNIRLDPADVENIRKEIKHIYTKHRDDGDVGFYKTSRAFYFPKKTLSFLSKPR